MLSAYLLSALCLLAFLFCSSTLHMSSLLFPGCLIKVLKALGWACSRKQYVLASQGLLGVFLNSRYSYGVPKNTLWAASKIMDLSHLGRP